jgi:xanthine dehydrogenase/oxidase
LPVRIPLNIPSSIAIELNLILFADGNLCRCTGNRPILTALKDFADNEPGKNPQDYGKDNVAKSVVPQGWEMQTTGWEQPNPEGLVKLNPPPLKTQNLKSRLPTYVLATSLSNAFEVYDQVKGHPNWIVRFQVGNTGTGIYPALSPVAEADATVWKKPKLRIDLSRVPEMNLIADEADHYSIGAATTYARFIDFIDSKADRTKDLFKQGSEERRLCALRYLAQRTAGRQIRNRGSLGGNTMMVVLYRKQREFAPFPSDLCTGLLTVGTQVVIVNLEGDRKPQTMSLYNLITNPPTLGKFILVKYLIPKTKPNVKTFSMTYKTAIRHTMAHSYVNGGITVDIVDGIIKNPVLAFGGIGPTDLAIKTAQVLEGAPLTQETLTAAAKTLNSELSSWAKGFSDWKKAVNAKIMFNGEDDGYLVSLGVGYLYKFLVTLATAVGDPVVDKSIQDIGLPNFLPPNYAKVTYGDRNVLAKAAKVEKPDAAVTLAHVPVIKYEAYAQVTGEVTYVREAGPPSRAVYFSWVYARRIGSFKYKIADGVENPEEQIVKDLEFVYGTSGVLSYITYASMLKKGLCPQTEIGPGIGGSTEFGGETLLIKGNVCHCVGDRIGLIVASSDKIAQKAAELIMTKLIKFEATTDPVYLKMEDYQADPNGPPNPDEWKSSRIPFPWGGVCYPDTASRDFDSQKRPIVRSDKLRLWLFTFLTRLLFNSKMLSNAPS